MTIALLTATTQYGTFAQRDPCDSDDMPTNIPRWPATIAVAALLVVAQPLFASDKPDFLTAHIDTSVHPGDDFFQYGNGAWFKRNPIPPTESTWGVGAVVREQLYATLRAIHERSAEEQVPAGNDAQKIGDFWHTAMDVEKARELGITPLRRELAQIDAAKNLAQALDTAFMMQTLGADPFFSLSIEQDLKQSDVISVYASQGGLGLPDRDFYFSNDKNIRQIRTAYVRHIARMLRLLGRKEADASAAAAGVMRFETALAKASRRLEDVRDPLRNYQRIAPTDFTRKHMPSVNWTERLAAWNLRPEYVVVGQPEFFSALERLLRQTPIPVLKDYLRLRLVSAYAEFLSPAVDDAHFDFYKRVLSGQREQRPRWKRVIDTEAGFGAVPESIGMIVARRFVAENFPERTKQRYADMTRALMDAYRERIEKLSWMTDTTKAKALAKLSGVTAKIGYPDRWQRPFGAGDRPGVLLREHDEHLALVLSGVGRALWQAGRSNRVAHDAADVQRLLQRVEQRDRAARGQLRRTGRGRRGHRRRGRICLWRSVDHRPRDHARVRRRGAQVRRGRQPRRLVDPRRRSGVWAQGGGRNQAVRRVRAAGGTAHQRQGDRWARTSQTSAVWRSRSMRSRRPNSTRAT